MAEPGPVFQAIQSKLASAFAPQHLEVFNESYMHNVPKGSETHFKVVVVSDKFDGKSLIQRHRMVNAVLEEELNQGVHALSIQSKTPVQWEANNTIRPSPTCQGGMKHEKKP
ncbi:BolA [Thraustotheca clavata]|uniref:BolA n=1 Tax=Thraustotheca clavata TaxID=74557 RepID=A0A1W0ACH0_9STRA|nr:BolA [Thraustotheca clavata]